MKLDQILLSNHFELDHKFNIVCDINFYIVVIEKLMITGENSLLVHYQFGQSYFGPDSHYDRTQSLDHFWSDSKLFECEQSWSIFTTNLDQK